MALFAPGGYATENISEYPKQPHTLEIDAKFQISLKNLKYGYRDTYIRI